MPTYEDILFRSGDLFLPTWLRNFLEYYYIGNSKSVFYVSNWSLVHFFTGMLVAGLFLKGEGRKGYTRMEIIGITFLIHTLWELWQIYGKNTPIHTLRGQVDVLVDTVFYMVGVLVRI
jgi:hypothetical protein